MCKKCDIAEKLLGYRDICPDSGKLEFTHDMLVKLGSNWCKRFGCSFVLPELKSCNCTGEIPDIFAFKSGYSMMIECKTSRADFLADKKKAFRINPELGMGQFRILLCPEGVIKPEDLKGIYENWFLLTVGQNKKIKLVVFPDSNYLNNPVHECNLMAERALMASALRRR